MIQDLSLLVCAGLVSFKTHPSLPLRIYNYTARAVKEMPAPDWPEALRAARGLVLDHTGRIVARPFDKFWNYEQVANSLPAGEYWLTEKLDGSLIIVFDYHGRTIVASRGSFESDQAAQAVRILESRYPGWRPEPDKTYLFEIIYPGNRVVVDYGSREDLVLLGTRDTVTGQETIGALCDAPFPHPATYRGNFDLRDLASQDRPNQEGFVLWWPCGFKCKIKFSRYVRLHRLMYGCSNRRLWSAAMKGEQLPLDECPPAFRRWAEREIEQFRRQFDEIAAQARSDYERIRSAPGRKEFALLAAQTKYPHLMFALLDGKPIEWPIWDLVWPKEVRFWGNQEDQE